MDEKLYINVSDLTRLKNAKNILSEIIPENSDIVTKNEFIRIHEVISGWIEKLYEKIEVK